MFGIYRNALDSASPADGVTALLGSWLPWVLRGRTVCRREWLASEPRLAYQLSVQWRWRAMGAALAPACLAAAACVDAHPRAPGAPGTPDTGVDVSHGQARGPIGVYAYFSVEEYAGRPVDQSQTNIDAYFAGMYASLLDNPAISGLDMRVHWATLNPNDPATSTAPYVWDPLDLAFAAVGSWNAAHTGLPPKTIQLNIIPGFESPAWIFDHMVSCDPPDSSPTADGGAPFVPAPPASPPPGQPCDYSYFLDIEGKAAPYVSRRLPMPWSQTYVDDWRGFLVALAARYGNDSAFVSIAIGGPTAASTEMIMPNDADIDPSTVAPPYATQWQSDLTHWNYLFAAEYETNPAYQNSDQAFIDAWSSAIDMYGEIFHDITLIITMGLGLPEFSPASSLAATVPAALQPACPDPYMECAAQASIVEHFLESSVAAGDAKAVEEEGFSAVEPYYRIDFDAAIVKWLTQADSAGPLLGGLEDTTTYSVREMAMGCLQFPSSCPDAEAPTERCGKSCSAASCNVPVNCAEAESGAAPSAEQTLYNMLQAYFDGTPAGPSFGMTAGPGRLNFYQLYADDIFYSQGMAGCISVDFVAYADDSGSSGLAKCTSAPPGEMIMSAAGVTFTTDQQLLEQASGSILQMAQAPEQLLAASGDAD